ncbi:MAG: DUF4331 domain-containing protein [Alcanivoracaceae bacterium]|nr:DUF4331 domain-containing protein [Alcanivoracaceae bacterium]
MASSHREAPYIAKYPQVDGTDFYAFNSYEPDRDDYVTFLANYIPVQAAYGGPNYFMLDENALYEIHIDNDGDAIEDITYQFRFKNSVPDDGIISFPIGSGENQKNIEAVLRNVGGVSAESAGGLNYVESYTLRIVTGDRRSGSGAFAKNQATDNLTFKKPFDYSGIKTFGGAGKYTEYANSFIHDIDIPNCDVDGKVFVGQRLDGFKIALGETFDLINFVPIEGDSAPGAGDGAGFPGGVTQDPKRNVLSKNNVTTIALEIPKTCLVGDGNGVIGSWTSASLRQVNILNPKPTLDFPEISLGRWTQVSRLGNFLINELFVGFSDKNSFNSSEPKNDGQFAKYVTHPVFPAIVNLLFKDAVNSTLGTNIADLAPTNIPRNDLVAGFLTGFSGVNQLKIVTPSEMLRLNTAILATARESQHPLGVAAGDIAGFPNGRRPGDDAVDIALRVAMGALCHNVPLGEDGTGINLGLCSPADAAVGNVALTDGAPISAMDFNNSFPYLLTPYPGSPNDAPIPTPVD